MRNVSYEIKTQLRQQGSSDPCFCVCNFNQHCCAGESSAWSRGCEKSAAVRMESGFSSADRWQVCGDHRTGSRLRQLAASRAPSLNSGHSVLRGLAMAEPGRTYVFTAMWDSNLIFLSPAGMWLTPGKEWELR